MRKLLTTTALALPLMAAAGTGVAVAATAYPQHIVESQLTASQFLRAAGYFQPNGVYVPTCAVVIVGYDAFGWPVYGTVCR
ncbi:MAG: hypothetical protein ACRDHZ_13105 [Ktedonobacteraceae bacterium]